MGTRPAIFKWRQTEPGLILCAVRWYLRYSFFRCAMLRNCWRSAVSMSITQRSGAGCSITVVWSRNSFGLKRRDLQPRQVSSDCLLHRLDKAYNPAFPVGSRNSKRLERRGLHSELSLAVDRGWKGENHAPTSQESEFERLCGTLGAIGKTGMPVEAHLVRGETAAPSPAAICGPLPRGAQSPGQAEPTAVPIAESRGERG